MPNTREKLIEVLWEYDQMRMMRMSIEECADRLVPKGLTVQQWIPVTERLPHEDLPVGALCEVVQVLLDDGSVTIGWCNRGLRCWFHMPVRETKMVGHDYENTPVIAWQPLNQPPKP